MVAGASPSRSVPETMQLSTMTLINAVNQIRRHEDLVNQGPEHLADTFDRHPLPRREPKSKSVEIGDDKPGRHSKAAGSNSARLSRKSSKASVKEPKVKRSSPESEDRSFHEREQLDQDVYQSHRRNEDVYNPQENSGPKLDQDAYNSQKRTVHKAMHPSRKSLIDNHSFRESSAKNVHHVAFTPDTCATPPAAAP